MAKLLSLFLLLAAAPLRAQHAEAPEIYAKLSPKVGAWGEYSFESKKDGKTKSKGKIHIAVVGKSGEGYWMEQRVMPEIPAPKKDRNVVMKMLVGAKEHKMFIKSDRGVMEMPSMAKGTETKHPDAAYKRSKMKKGADESVTVAAGTFKATRYSFDDEKASGDTWVKPGVGPYGLIKQARKHGDDGMTMELLSYGDDAKSEVDETTAKKMPSMADMIGGRQGGGMPDMETLMKMRRKKGGD